MFNPTGASGYEGCTWCPLTTATTYAGALTAAAWLCDSSRVEKLTSNEQQLWDTLGQQLMAPVLYAAARTGGTMGTVVDWVLFEQESLVDRILEELGDRTALGHWRSINRNPERTKRSIYMTAQKILHVFGHPAMVDALTPGAGERGFEPEQLLEAGGTLYVVAPAEDQELFTPVFESLVNAVVRAGEKRSMANRGLPLEPRLLLMLDEAANCAPLRQLPRVASTGRGMGIVTVSVWQDESQIETIYGATPSRTVLANHTGRLMLPGCTDVTTLKHMSDLLGPRSVRRTGESVGVDGRVSTSTSWQTEPLAPVDYIRELETGEALAVVGREKPIRLHTTAWFEDDRLRALITPRCRSRLRRRVRPATAAEAPTPGDSRMSDERARAADAAAGDPFNELIGLVEDLLDRVDTLEARLIQEESELDPDQLGEWVGWLVATYRLEDTIRPGWESVPGVRRELDALRAAWHTAHDPDGRPHKRFDAVQWHDALARALARIKDPWYHADHGRAGIPGPGPYFPPRHHS